MANCDALWALVKSCCLACVGWIATNLCSICSMASKRSGRLSFPVRVCISLRYAAMYSFAEVVRGWNRSSVQCALSAIRSGLPLTFSFGKKFSSASLSPGKCLAISSSCCLLLFFLDLCPCSTLSNTVSIYRVSPESLYGLY